MPSVPLPSLAPPSRRAFLTTALGLGAAGTLSLAGCSTGSGTGAVQLAADAPLPTAVPTGTSLRIAITTSQVQLTTSGLIKQLPFTVGSWANVSAGPDVIEAFRANSVDLANNAGIPPIQARAIGYDAKIVAVQLTTKPIYVFATAPGSSVTSVADFRGKRIAFSQGQAQGVVVLRALKEAGIGFKDADLVQLTSNQFLTALQSRQVDVAVLAEPVTTKYIDEYQKDGARVITTDVVDYLSVLWAPSSVLADRGKAAAIRDFIPVWARGVVWAYENPAAWIEAYYVKNQGVTTLDGQRIVKAQPKPVFPVKWDGAIAWEQTTSDLLSAGGYDPKVNASDLFDRRFEGIAAAAVPSGYRV